MVKRPEKASTGLGSTAMSLIEQAKRAQQKNVLPDTSHMDESDSHYENLELDILEDAPQAWNKYPLLKDMDEAKYKELKHAIYTQGVLEAIIVWHHNGKYMILSGHNRKSISHDLTIEHPDLADRWNTIKCYVFEEEELTELEARSIVHQTNIYRDPSKMPKRVQNEIIMDRIEVMVEMKTPKGEMTKELMKSLNLGSSQVYDLRTIATNLHPDLKELYYDGMISVPNAVALSKSHKSIQQHLAENYLDVLDNKKISKFKPMLNAEKNKNLSLAERIANIDNIMNDNKVEMPKKKVTFIVPVDKMEEFKAYANAWIKENCE